MSLLTDKKILAALNEAWGNDGEDTINDVECGDRAIADASQAVTLKAVAKWGNTDCDSEFHDDPDIPRRRRDCPECRREGWFALRKGELPGEENDAVHTTRKTPRTISPD